MIRSILLPLADGPLSKSAVDHALWLAKKDGCRIQAVAVIDIKAFEIPVLGTPDGFMPSVVTPPIAETQTLLQEMNAQARERLDKFAAECGSRGIACATDTRTGLPGEIIAREAMAHDLVVMARGGYTRSAAPEEKLDPLVHQVIRGSIRPVLVAGPKFTAAETLNLLVAFDGSVHAGKALAIAAELGSRPGVNCTVVTIAALEDVGAETLAPAVAYLQHHGVMPRKQVIVGAKPSEVICDLVCKSGVDILIMGAFGHRPMREMLFGSTTEKVLAHCPATVILQA
jgi:nucleotide-binding universal stress UspA family protein